MPGTLVKALQGMCSSYVDFALAFESHNTPSVLSRFAAAHQDFRAVYLILLC
jgi:hypothetical protein